MNSNITITVNTGDHNSLIRASGMLAEMASDLTEDTVKADNVVSLKPIPAPVVTPDAPAPVVTPDAPAPVVTPDAPAPVAPVGVELDKAGLPWDARIHGVARKKTTKDDLWKKIRGVDPELVVTVEAELRAAMAAPVPAITETPAPTKAPAPPAPTKAPTPPAPVTEPELFMLEGKEYTAEQLAAAGWEPEQIAELPKFDDAIPPATTGITFPELMAKITPALTAKTITEARVTEVCTGKGLASLALLAARPDLIAGVDAELFG